MEEERFLIVKIVSGWMFYCSVLYIIITDMACYQM